LRRASGSPPLPSTVVVADAVGSATEEKLQPGDQSQQSLMTVRARRDPS
jgi:hypothetical protein